MQEPTHLALHSKGSPVFSLQQDLSFLGFDVPQHGVFDEKTQQAVRAFQAQHLVTGGVTSTLQNLIDREVVHKKTLMERAQGGEEAEEYEVDGMTSNPIKDIPIIEQNSTDRGGWVPNTIIIGYTGTVGPEHTFALLNIKHVLSAHYIVWEEGTGRCVPEERACWLGGYCPDPTLPLRSVVILVENMGPLRGSHEKGYTHGAFPEVQYDAQVYGLPVQSFDPSLGNTAWQPFASSQIEAVKVLCKRLQEKWGISNVIGLAEAIGTPSPGPAFPLQEVIDYLTPEEPSDV